MLRRAFFQATAATAVLAAIHRLLSPRWSFAKGTAVTDDPMLAPWTGPHGGFPRFDKFKPTDVKPALMKGMDLFRAEIAEISAAKDHATFENTIVALEDAGRPFGRVASVFNVYRSTMNDKAMQ